MDVSDCETACQQKNEYPTHARYVTASSQPPSNRPNPTITFPPPPLTSCCAH